jgi:hypothetical protein
MCPVRSAGRGQRDSPGQRGEKRSVLHWENTPFSSPALVKHRAAYFRIAGANKKTPVNPPMLSINTSLI